MTIIVASLFLPYQPQFVVQSNEFDANLVNPSLVKVKIPNENQKNKRSDSVHTSPFAKAADVGSTEFHGSMNGISDQLAGPVNQGEMSGLGTPTISDGDMISGDLFIENLTANASVIGSPRSAALPQKNANKTASIDEFFPSSSAQLPETTSLRKKAVTGSGLDSNFHASNALNNDISPSLSVISSPASESSAHANIATHLANDMSTSTLLKNVNKSLLYQNVLKGNSQTSLEGHTMKSASSHRNTVITPKSKTVPDFQSSAVVNFAKVRQQNQETSLPSMRRVPLMTDKSGSLTPTSVTGGIGTRNVPSHLKYEIDSKYIATSESDEEDGKSDDSDLENNSSTVYNVPGFGGYSNNEKIKSSLLKRSKYLFSQIPWDIVAGSKGNGALKNAIETAILEKTITEPVQWIGTVGMPTDEIPSDIIANISDTLSEKFASSAVITDDITFKGAYKNFCKQILWPTLHYQIPDNPNSKAFEDHSWGYYQKLNQQFADKIVENYKVGDIVWVNDYHLMLVPAMVRAKIATANIGFFLHVSFPSSEVFRCFAHREDILRGIIGSNFVGFQTKEYERHFKQTCSRLLLADITENGLKYKGNMISSNHIPMGVDVFRINQQIKNAKVVQWRQLIRERWAGKKLIIGRDQYDRIRGLDRKLLAYERFLRENPHYIEKVVLIQICLGKANDPELERQIMMTVDRINAMSQNISISQPVVFLHQDLDFEQYLAINCEADAFFVDALREGMNLTCHEFIACSEEKNSPLLLSEFTGSADVLKDGALLINPWDIKKVSENIKRALEMSFEEKRRAWKKIMKSIIKNDSDNWITTISKNIKNSWEFNEEISRVFYVSTDEVFNDYLAAKKHLFILKISEPPSARMISILNDLTTHNIVYILANFSKTTLESLYSRVTNIGLIAENGAYVRLSKMWYNIVEEVDWMTEVVKILDDKVERLPGSYYKIAESMVRFHTENAEDKNRVAGVVGEAITHINTLFSERGIHAYIHKDIMFVQQFGLSLSAAQFILRYYNSTTTSGDSNSTPGTPRHYSSRSNSGLHNDYFGGTSQHHVDFFCVTGSSSPSIEPLFHLVSQESQKGLLKYGHSIVYGNATSTFAKEHIDGYSELFTMLEHMTKTQHIRAYDYN
ncbi:hypothetical protein TPHA_0I00490 [Tetrapisispora phaffii CBS 4417]|uniref:Uncharacterized protein n=1 Tax=Tetrapisispora phaffii (strain ATCC 24235 / CBS 4417 / NBRC 1672 / NRRL Y-8282 / UCD 70-5) TaxID=1071381 RepID=G8BXC7_TETPH|nr:hypothetical protein TPHA_0I00490 [Tetrapisispora phaffii CBS 4417]CCE64555.1 hypothetical protein TPHA_0I00490 [Tetrapisispora phaffii CBS 4417]